MALAHLRKAYGPEEFLKHKDDIHPGHVSLETDDQYLSIGTLDLVSSIGLRTEHRLDYTDTLSDEMLGFGRMPEGRADLYVLDKNKINNAIQEFKKSPAMYSLLGKRFGFSSGESCSTAVYLCLEEGGVSALLRPDQDFLSRNNVITPVSLFNYIQKAQERALQRYPSIRELTAEFAGETERLAKDLEERMKELRGNHGSAGENSNNLKS